MVAPSVIGVLTALIVVELELWRLSPRTSIPGMVDRIPLLLLSLGSVLHRKRALVVVVLA